MHIYYTKKAATFLCAVLSCSALFIIIFGYVAAHKDVQTVGKVSGRYDNTVIIDPGHGQPDGGAIGVDGVIEKNINLAISLRLRSFFEVAGYTVIMTRDDDNAIYDKGSNTIREKKATDLHNRLAIANSHPNALFISIHQNIYKSSNENGSLVLYSPNNADGKNLAQSIQTAIQNMLQPENSRTVKQAQKNLYILYYAKTPCVLVECGFLSNPAECKLLQKDEYQNNMAFAIFCGTMKFYTIAEK